MLIAKSFADALDSGKRPEKPPLATTAGSCPKRQKKKEVYFSKNKTTCYVILAEFNRFRHQETIKG